jgi:hypothetical protein
LFLVGCQAIDRNYVITGTGTILGVQVAENPTTQLYEAKFGYSRAETALVPTNGVSVLMELKYSGIFSRSGGIYQRLAVGDVAVRQPGASFMFAKDANGQVSTNVADAISRKLESTVPIAPK